MRRFCFNHADKARPILSGEAGLGLAIVNQVVEPHKGEILVESESNVGTTFHLTFPK